MIIHILTENSVGEYKNSDSEKIMF
jgi:hypothetical protein